MKFVLLVATSPSEGITILHLYLETSRLVSKRERETVPSSSQKGIATPYRQVFTDSETGSHLRR